MDITGLLKNIPRMFNSLSPDVKPFIIIAVLFVLMIFYMLLKANFILILMFVAFLIVASIVGYFIYKIFIRGRTDQGHSFVFAFMIMGLLVVPSFVDAQANAPLLERIEQEDLDNAEMAIKSEIAAACGPIEGKFDILNSQLKTAAEEETNNPYFEILFPVIIVQIISLFLTILYIRSRG